MKFSFYLFILITFATILNGQGISYKAGVDFIADSSQGFTLTDGPNTVTVSGTVELGNSFSFLFPTPVDISPFLLSGTILDFTTNSGHSANSPFIISLFDSTFKGECFIMGLNFSDTTLVSSSSIATYEPLFDFTDIHKMVIHFGISLFNLIDIGALDIGANVNINISSIRTPGISTYVLETYSSTDLMNWSLISSESFESAVDILSLKTIYSETSNSLESHYSVDSTNWSLIKSEAVNSNENTLFFKSQVTPQ